MKKTLKNKKIFVAGHNGMVGSSILRYLKKSSIKKIIVQNRNKLDLTYHFRTCVSKSFVGIAVALPQQKCLSDLEKKFKDKIEE